MLDKDKIKQAIFSLCSVMSVSGFEKRATPYIESTFKDSFDSISCDAVGNHLLVKKCQKENAPKIIIDAHMDEVGMIVRGINENGLISYGTVGSIDPRTIVSKPVRIGDDEVPGVIGAKAIHLQRGAERETVLPHNELYIDIGAKDKKEAERKVQIGEFCALDGGITRLCGRRIAGRPLDDRIGCAVLVKIAEKLQETPVANDVYFVFSVQEEVGVRGAKTATFGITPDIGLAFDVTGTGDAMGAKPMACSVGGGAAIKLKDASVICDRELTEELTAVAKENGIKHQFEILLAGGTDTSSMQMSGAGVRAAALSIPTRYIHSGVEMLDLADAEACVDLTVAYLKK